jgi:hypothetical protein
MFAFWYEKTMFEFISEFTCYDEVVVPEGAFYSLLRKFFYHNNIEDLSNILDDWAV